jgi:hypothetical protein
MWASGSSRKIDEPPPEGQEAMWCHCVLASVLLTGMLPGRISAQTPVLVRFLEGDTRSAVQRAVEGAAARLSRLGCQDLFADLTDEGGERLSTKLQTRGRSPAEGFGLLRFFDDRGAPQCRDSKTLAFTQIGSPIIRVCALQFRNRFAQNRTTTEIILIHEFLHTLGMGENPPTSEAITKRTAFRCGD